MTPGATSAEEIQFEALRRLHLGHGLSLDDIDATNVLPALRSTNRDGLIYRMTQRCVRRVDVILLLTQCALRDKLFWTGVMAEFPTDAGGFERREINPRAHEPGIDDLRKRVESIVPYFCASPSCVQSLCPYHGRSFIRLALAS